MPELPEVETIKNGIIPHLLGQKVTHAELFRKDLRIPFPPGFCKTLTGSHITAIDRRSKYICITLNDALLWVIHLGMSGQVLLYDTPPTTLQKHDHVRVQLSNGYTLLYRDPRRFGLMTTLPLKEAPQHPLFAALGPEPLTEEFTGTVLYNAIHHRRTAIKPTLMDAGIVVGVGNIYASESLFRAGIRPTRPCNSITKKEATLLVKCIKQVLQEAIISGGSTLRDYVRSSGDSGYFQHHFAVYDRAGEPCITCGSAIQKFTQQQRSTYYCGKCQR